MMFLGIKSRDSFASTPGPNVKINTKYQGELQWTLTDAPI